MVPTLDTHGVFLVHGGRHERNSFISLNENVYQGETSCATISLQTLLKGNLNRTLVYLWLWTDNSSTPFPSHRISSEWRTEASKVIYCEQNGRMKFIWPRGRINWTERRYRNVHLDKCIRFSVYWPFPCSGSSHATFSTTSTPSSLSDCSWLCLAIMYSCPMWYYKEIAYDIARYADRTAATITCRS